MSPEEFFNKNFGAAVESMTNEEMSQVLKELAETEFFVAVLKYNRMRKQVIQGSLFTMDPIKDPTSMARAQGMLAGMSDLEDAVFHLTKKQTPEEEK
jgi:hypothetical protein